MTAFRVRRLRAPADDGAALFDPPLSEAARLVADNASGLEALDRSGRFPQGFRMAARRSLIQQAMGSHTDLPAPAKLAPFILTGHQPELYHPGVWLKNFAADAVAKAVQGRAFNLIVDNDLCRHASIRVPSGLVAAPSIETVRFDRSSQPIPWEMRPIDDSEMLGRFDTSVRASYSTYLKMPAYADGMVLEKLWPHILDAAKDMQASEGGLAKSLMHGRRVLERQAGLALADCPLSVVGDSPEFLRFAGDLLREHGRFREIYNAALAEYRYQNRIRSHTHPVPELVQAGEWHEAPFWIWTREEPLRKRVFVRRSGNDYDLTDRGSVLVSLSRDRASECNRDLDVLRERGIKLRPRALLTTMYARLVLSDLFIHGIGGAKYDELTDLIIRRFFGIEPPAYLTATATFRLPIDRPHVSAEDVRYGARRLRELRYRPESFLSAERVRRDGHVSQQLAALALEKREYLAAHDLRRCSPAVFAQLDRLNERMVELLQPLERELLAQHGELLTQLKHAQLLSSREFSFVLFPSEILPARLLDLCKLLS